LFTPSFSDVLFVMVVAWSFLTSKAGWLALVMDGDSGFHIRIGDWIRAAHRVPVTHPFSFSVTGKEWFAFEWLSELGMAWLHAMWGLKGVTLTAGVVIATVFVVLFRYTVWRGANPIISLVLVMVAVNTCRVHFWARPHLLTWLMLTVSIWMLEADRRAPSRAVWILVPLMALWANLHGGFVLFFALMALWMAGLDSWRAVRRYALVGAACLVASLLNPYGYRLHRHIFEVMGAKWITDIVTEFKSPSFRTEPMMAFMLLLFLALATLWPLMERRRVGDVLWILFLAWSALISVRHVPVFALVIAPILATEYTRAWERLTARASPRGALRIVDEVGSQFAAGAARTSLWPAVFVAWLAFVPGLAWPSDFPSDLFPTHLIDRHPALAEARVFTTDQWSDYLIYRNYPRQRDYVDGQHQYYGEKHVGEYLDTLGGQPNWASTLERFRFDYALCPAGMPLVSLLGADRRWQLLDRGDGAVLFTRVGR
jgi:hypothetical protein